MNARARRAAIRAEVRHLIHWLVRAPYDPGMARVLRRQIRILRMQHTELATVKERGILAMIRDEICAAMRAVNQLQIALKPLRNIPTADKMHGHLEALWCDLYDARAVENATRPETEVVS